MDGEIGGAFDVANALKSTNFILKKFSWVGLHPCTPEYLGWFLWNGYILRKKFPLRMTKNVIFALQIKFFNNRFTSEIFYVSPIDAIVSVSDC